MKNIIVIMVLFFGFLTQSKSQNKEVIKFEVQGVCGMCKDRIESALDVKGVIYATWNVETKEVEIAYKTKKISEMQLHQLLADAGHTTCKVKASKEAYDNLHNCCKYEELKTH